MRLSGALKTQFSLPHDDKSVLFPLNKVEDLKYRKVKPEVGEWTLRFLLDHGARLSRHGNVKGVICSRYDIMDFFATWKSQFTIARL